MSEQQTDDQRQAMQQITQSVMSLMDMWSLETEEMQKMLSLPTNYRARAFHKLREGRDVLPTDVSVMRRATYLLRIADALRTAYPCNPRMASRWIRMPHRRFGRRTPLSMILADESESGMIAVLSELDCTFSWDLTGSSCAK
ncbi:MAG: MbcA/ParS/Xre antitoxin family protein [Gammaproteobacteria bacterium]|jgi:hypothetical protein